MEAIFTELLKNLPSAAAVIITVVYFIRYIEKRDDKESKRDETITHVLTNLSVAVNTLAERQTESHEFLKSAIVEMRTITRRRKNDPN